jgi:hypothetical protein
VLGVAWALIDRVGLGLRVGDSVAPVPEHATTATATATSTLAMAEKLAREPGTILAVSRLITPSTPRRLATAVQPPNLIECQ